MWSELQKYEQVKFIQSSIHQVGEDEQGAFVRTTEGILRGDYVLNSVQPGKEDKQKWPTYQLWQHFAGWWIETDRDVFDPENARLMDFRPDQHGDSRFMYVLPYSRRKALVEFTVFSRQLLTMEAYEREIAQYMEQYFPDTSYSVIEKERGKIPMTNKKHRRYQHARVLNIGTVGGAVKPTTGYAFLRIQSEAQQLAQNLLRGERAADTLTSAVRFTFYDRLLLHILTHHGHRGAGIFSALFRANPMRRILTFLNEKSTLWQEIKIFAHLPYGPFLRALGAQLWYRWSSWFSRKWYQNWTPTPATSLEQEHQIIQQKL